MLKEERSILADLRRILNNHRSTKEREGRKLMLTERLIVQKKKLKNH
jgi:hypothetical protein